VTPEDYVAVLYSLPRACLRALLSLAESTDHHELTGMVVSTTLELYEHRQRLVSLGFVEETTLAITARGAAMIAWLAKLNEIPLPWPPARSAARKPPLGQANTRERVRRVSYALRTIVAGPSEVTRPVLQFVWMFPNRVIATNGGSMVVVNMAAPVESAAGMMAEPGLVGETYPYTGPSLDILDKVIECSVESSPPLVHAAGPLVSQLERIAKISHALPDRGIRYQDKSYGPVLLYNLCRAMYWLGVCELTFVSRIAAERGMCITGVSGQVPVTGIIMPLQQDPSPVDYDLAEAGDRVMSLLDFK